MQMQTAARVTMQPVSGSATRLSKSFASGRQPRTLNLLSRSRSLKRQIAMAENPVSKAVNKAKKAAEDFGDAIQSNAEDTAEKTESAYKSAKPGDDDKNPTDTYRSTELKKSDKKYTPKSDPKK